MFNQTTQAVLNQLSLGEFCSGQYLGEQLGVSRAAISKHIAALQALGLDIYSVTGKGYKLANRLDLLSKQTLNNKLPEWPAENIQVETLVDSTNLMLKQKIQAGELITQPAGFTLLAEAQTAGRGRRGREWVSPLGASLYFSTHWRFEQGISATMGLSLAVGIALCEALTQLGVTGLGLKWPNDVYLDGKKLAGILIELESQASDSCDIVIGVGLNIKLPGLVDKLIDQPFTDLSGFDVCDDRNLIAATLLEKMWLLLSSYEQYGFKAMVQRWQHFDCFTGQLVDLVVGEKVISGRYAGVDAQGGVKITIAGELHTFFGGEISLRKTSSNQQGSKDA